MKYRYIVLIILVAAGVVLGGGRSPALAQSDNGSAQFKNVTLWINPEYDDPGLLVMLEGEIAGVDVPTQIRFLVPTVAEMYSAGSKDAQGKYSGGPPDRQASGLPGWDEISYQLQSNVFRVEYYDPIIPAQPDKKISYDFRHLYPISDLRVIVQEPRKSTNFVVSPPGVAGVDREGFTVHSYTYSNLSADSTLHFDIAYTKTDPHPSLVIDTTASTGSTNIPLIVGILAGLVAAAVLVWQLRRSRSRPVKSYAARNAPGASGRRNARNQYCSKCGNPVESSHRFCRYCGSKLNKPD